MERRRVPAPAAPMEEADEIVELTMDDDCQDVVLPGFLSGIVDLAMDRYVYEAEDADDDEIIEAREVLPAQEATIYEAEEEYESDGDAFSSMEEEVEEAEIPLQSAEAFEKELQSLNNDIFSAALLNFAASQLAGDQSEDDLVSVLSVGDSDAEKGFLDPLQEVEDLGQRWSIAATMGEPTSEELEERRAVVEAVEEIEMEPFRVAAHPPAAVAEARLQAASYLQNLCFSTWPLRHAAARDIQRGWRQYKRKPSKVLRARPAALDIGLPTALGSNAVSPRAQHRASSARRHAAAVAEARVQEATALALLLSPQAPRTPRHGQRRPLCAGSVPKSAHAATASVATATAASPAVPQAVMMPTSPTAARPTTPRGSQQEVFHRPSTLRAAAAAQKKAPSGFLPALQQDGAKAGAEAVLGALFHKAAGVRSPRSCTPRTSARSATPRGVRSPFF